MEYNKITDSKISTETINNWRKSGKKALGIVCCHVPFELLHAAEILPVRLRATACKTCIDAEACMGEENCGFTKGILQYLIDGVYELDGVLMSDGCSVSAGISNQWKIIAPKQNKSQYFYEISAPRMNNDAALKFFHSELDDLREELETLSGNKITNEKLKHSVDTYNEARRLVQQIYKLHKAERPVISGEETLRITLAATEMPIEDYIEFLKAALADMEGREPVPEFGARVMLVGSALDDPDYVREIEACGCLVVADLNSFGVRFLRDELPYEESDVMASISKYYLSRSSCPRMMDGSDSIHQYIFDTAEEYRADGVIIERLSHCDKWENEGEALGMALKKKGIPFISMERLQQKTAPGQLQIRVEAFREMLEK
ncbi:MAG: 2-hydroxyacyl-CoA dehydratase family protein [Oscillospiraceae bacterium]